jgi:hypothetical protein
LFDWILINEQSNSDLLLGFIFSVDLTAFERCDRRHRSAVRQRFIFWTTHWERGRKAEKGRELPVGNYRPREAVVVERDAGEALDAALAAFMGAIEECD